MRNARVFISCGQRNEQEAEIGLSIDKYFKNRGFETYFAERVHSSDALTENIFRFLRKSEYFIFVDFKREQITDKEFRGSLFVNQEIAIATFLKFKGIGFYEKGVKREGILDYHIYNAFPFNNKDEIIEVLEKETLRWDANSTNELDIIYVPELISRNLSFRSAPQKKADWYHLAISNRNKSEHAFSCLAYVTKIKDLNNNTDYEICTNELAWAGIASISVNIMAGTKRDLDAFHVVHGEDEIRFNQRSVVTTTSRYSLPILPLGIYLIGYTVISSNFDMVNKSYVLEYEGAIEDIKFRSPINFIKDKIIPWVQNKESIRQISLYGSRARCDYKENSDWDIVVVIDASKYEDNLTIWISDGGKWEKELKEITNFDIHLEWLDLEGNSTPTVMRKYNRGNVLIYDRNNRKK